MAYQTAPVTRATSCNQLVPVPCRTDGRCGADKSRRHSDLSARTCSSSPSISIHPALSLPRLPPRPRFSREERSTERRTGALRGKSTPELHRGSTGKIGSRAVRKMPYKRILGLKTPPHCRHYPPGLTQLALAGRNRVCLRNGCFYLTARDERASCAQWPWPQTGHRRRLPARAA